MKTKGISKKLIATLIAACGAQSTALIVNLVASGEFDRTEAGQLAGLALTALFGFAGGWASQPDEQEPVGTTYAVGGSE